MIRRSPLAMMLAAGLIAGLVATSGSPAIAKDFEIVTETYIAETRHGDIYVEVARPVDGTKTIKAPAILTYSPYSAVYAEGRTAGWENYVGDGYARVFADLVGTGNSGGCYDYGGTREKESAYDLVEWIAKQKWSNGKVAMIGTSYEGTTATAAAVTKPPHLTTIIPQAAISRWYGYAYSGGIRYFLNSEAIGPQGPGTVADQGFDTPAVFDFGLAVPPPTDVNDPTWAQRFQSSVTPCDEIEHTEHGYDDTPDYDAFWKERDYLRDADEIEIPVLVATNWGDWDVKQEESWNLFRALKRSEKRVLYMGTRWKGHGAPSAMHYSETVRQWLDHYLMGINNRIDKMPAIVTQTSDYDGPGQWFRYGEKGPKTRDVTLIAQQYPTLSPEEYLWQIRPEMPNLVALSFGGEEPRPATWPSANINTEAHAAHHCRANHDWFCFESPVLKRDMRIFGPIKVKVWLHAHRKWITMTPSIFDVDPELHTAVPTLGHACVPDPEDGPTACARALTPVTRGWLDSRYRNSLAKQQDVKPMKSFEMTVVTKPQDYVFKAGHIIMINFQTEILEWSLPKPYPGCEGAGPGWIDPASPGDTELKNCANVWLDWGKGQTRVILPVVNAPKHDAMLFSGVSHQH